MPKKILLADDSITIQKVVELTFSDGDYEVIAVNNGAKAIQKLSEMRPDIILSDIIMPEKNGYEVVLTKFLAAGNDLSANIPDWFGSWRLAPLGTLQAGICWNISNAPKTLSYEIDGVDSEGNKITTTASIPFNPAPALPAGPLSGSVKTLNLNVAATQSVNSSVGVGVHVDVAQPGVESRAEVLGGVPGPLRRRVPEGAGFHAAAGRQPEGEDQADDAAGLAGHRSPPWPSVRSAIARLKPPARCRRGAGRPAGLRMNPTSPTKTTTAAASPTVTGCTSVQKPAPKITRAS